MPTAHQELAVRWYEEVWNKGRREAIAEMMDAKCVLHDGATDSVGIAGFEAYFDRLQAAFTEMDVTVDDVFGDGDKVTARWSARFRHTGPGMGVPPTGKKLSTTGITILRIANGKFVEGWQNWDMHGLLEQIGAAESSSRPLTVTAETGG